MDCRPRAPKVAIPRLSNDYKSPQNGRGKSRARKACDNCRKHKVKCTGEQSHCQKCVNEHIPCVYSKSRKDRLKECVARTLEIASLTPSRATKQNSQLIALLKDLTAYVDDGWRGKIYELLDSVCLLKSNAPLVLIYQS